MTLDECANILDNGGRLHSKARVWLGRRYEHVQGDVVRLREQIEREQLELARLSEEEDRIWRLKRADDKKQ